MIGRHNSGLVSGTAFGFFADLVITYSTNGSHTSYGSTYHLPYISSKLEAVFIGSGAYLSTGAVAHPTHPGIFFIHPQLDLYTTVRCSLN